MMKTVITWSEQHTKAKTHGNISFMTKCNLSKNKLSKKNFLNSEFELTYRILLNLRGALDFCRYITSHEGMNRNVTIKRARGKHVWIAWTPLDIKTPLGVRVQFTDNLNIEIRTR